MILRDERRLTLDNVRTLSLHFGVQPEVFLQDALHREG